MPKGEDHLQKKRAKAVRKRMRRVGADSFEAIQGVQAAKRRRKSGTRRACEGMCYTLPTPDDPFNERSDRRKRRQENRKLRSKEVPEGEILEFETDVDLANGSGIDVNAGYEKQLKKKKRKLSEDSEEEELEALPDGQKRRKIDLGSVHDDSAAVKLTQNGNGKTTPSKSERSHVGNAAAPSLNKEREDIDGNVINGLVLAALSEAGLSNGNAVKVDAMNGDAMKEEKESSVFRAQCRAAMSKGVDVVAVASQGWEDRVLGYAVPAAVHIKAQLAKDAAVRKPLVLITVASQHQALQVRSVCKPLKKALGISSVCVHTGTSLDSQIRGFSMLTPEIVVATPERLVELLAVNAISLLSVLLLVIDELDEIVDKGFRTELTKLKENLPKESQTFIISGTFSKNVVNVARELVVDPIERVVSEPDLKTSGVCVAQEVSVFTSPDKRLPKLLKILQQVKHKREESAARSTLILVENVEAVEKLLPAIQEIRDDDTLGLTVSKRSQLALVSKKLRQGSVKTLVTTEEFLGQIPLERMQVVINYSFPSSMQVYEQILTGMARGSVNGELHSLCTPSMASMARDLVEVLQKSLQEVPRGLQMLAEAAAIVQKGKQ